MDHIAALRIFLHVADANSFSRAADSMKLPKASVSTAVQSLETRLGVRLFQRTTRRVALTDDGARFYERCRDVLSDFDEMQEMFHAGDAKLTGRIRLGVPAHHLATDLIVPRLPEFLARYPGVELEMTASDLPVDLVREGFDCVLRVGKLADASWVARSLPDVPMVNVASAAYVRTHGMPKTIEALRKHAFIHYAPNFAALPCCFEYLEDGARRTVPVKPAVTFASTELLVPACIAGLGLLQTPDEAARPHLERGTLVEFLPTKTAPPLPMSILYPHRRNLARRVAVFMDWLMEVLTAHIVRPS